MEHMPKLTLTDAEKNRFIAALTPELTLLRTRAGISQEDLAMLIGVSRQTYGAIERRTRKMSWGTFLSLIMFYDYNEKTHQLLRDLGVFPRDVVVRFNNGKEIGGIDLASVLGEGASDILRDLDEQALRSIRTMIMVEYARCNQLSGEAVVKAFDGVTFFPSKAGSMQAVRALKAIKEKAEKK